MSTEQGCDKGDLIKPEDLAKRLGTSAGVLANWRYMGQGPKFIKVVKSIRYRASDVEAWLDANTHQQSGEESK